MPEVKPIPEGMHTVTPHLCCRDAAAAMDFYKRAFGAIEIARQTTPDGKILHAAIQIGDSPVMLVDEFPDWQCLGPESLNGSPVTLHLYVEDADAFMKRAVEAGAKETMPLQDTFWGDRYGKLEDPFGHSWSIGTHKRDVSPAEMDQAVKAMFSG
ncbi:MAG: VOC family protein [Gammaproteobacteria bacterium]